MRFLEYVPGDSFLHRMNPAAKLIAAVVLCLACFLARDPLIVVALLIGGFCLAASCGMLKPTIGLAKAVAAFSIILALIRLLTTPEGDVLLALPWGYVGTVSVIEAVVVIVRMVAAAIPLFLVFYVTRLTDLGNAMVQVLHVPYKYAFMFTSTVRFIPVFMNDMRDIMEAQTARGVEFDTPSLARKVSLMVPLCVPLLVSSVRKTNSAAIAAEVRGFYLRDRTSAYKRYPLTVPDWAVLGVCAAVLLVAIFL